MDNVRGRYEQKHVKVGDKQFESLPGMKDGRLDLFLFLFWE